MRDAWLFEDESLADGAVQSVKQDRDADVSGIEVCSDVLLNETEGNSGGEERVDTESFALFGRNLFGDAIEPPSRGKLSDQFVVPPFSVLDARSGYWQDRKRAWLALGIESELGRGAGVWIESDETGSPADRQRDYQSRLSPGGSARPACDYSQRERGDGAGRPIGRTDGNLLGFSAAATIRRGGVGFDGSKVLRRERSDLDRSQGLGATCDAYRNAGDEVDGAAATGTSIFDPIICELTYRWFCPPHGFVLDPFAGGSVRGIVAALLERQYYGIDLSARQIKANQIQAARICGDLKPTWAVGDAMTVALPTRAAVLLSCPPYGDLEIYSDDSRDLSQMAYPEFLAAYRAIIARCAAVLADDRFACFLVGDFRDDRGIYRNFVAETIAAFQAAGLEFYNEAILVTAVGSLPIRVTKGFNVSRKLGRTHQHYLCFVKGDPRRAAEACNGQLELPS